MGRYFGGISYSAVTKIGTRLKERMRQVQRLRSEMREMNNDFSHACRRWSILTRLFPDDPLPEKSKIAEACKEQGAANRRVQ